MLPDRTVSAEGRPIHDMRIANEASPKEQHPPALQPRHRQLARVSLWWQARHPGVKQVCAKRDVSRAFKWHWVKDEDVEEFGASLPGQEVGVEGRVVLINLVLVFGWSGSPGEYMIFAWAAKNEHEFMRPNNPEINGTPHFASKWLMDGGVIIEPLVGLRPWLSAAGLEKAMIRVWGPGAVNGEKREEEGSFDEEQLIWGPHMNFQSQKVCLPEQKCVKAKYLLSLPQLQHGCRKVQLKVAQELRGCAQYWSTAQPAVSAELGTLDRMLVQKDVGSSWVEPRAEGDALEEIWQEWDETLQLFE